LRRRLFRNLLSILSILSISAIGYLPSAIRNPRTTLAAGDLAQR